jgi:nitroreductase
MTEEALFRAIGERVSTRTFDGERFDSVEVEKFRSILNDSDNGGEGNPFGHEVRLAFYEGEKDSGPVRLGTYGLVSGMAGFVVATVKRGAGSMEDVGFVVERIVLEATVMGFASCWIGGVFSRAKAGQVIGVREDEVVPVVIAVGRAAPRRSVFDRVVTSAARARQRKPFGDLFFGFARSGDPKADAWMSALEAVRAAPSASNKQPWRIVREPIPGNREFEKYEWRFFLDEDKAYNNALGDIHLQNLDIGIAMRHFQAACAALGLPGKWSRPDFDSTSAPGKSWIPIASWR